MNRLESEREENSIPRGQIISCLKDCKMIARGCLYCVVRVKDLECETSSIDLGPRSKGSFGGFS